MPRHIHETTEVGLICLLKQGKPAGSKVVFVVMHDDAEVKRLDGSVVADPQARAGKAATVKYKTPAVADTKTHYVITYKALADGEEYLGGDEIHVWPLKGKLNSRNEDDTKPLKKFKFAVMQGGTKGTDVFKTDDKDPSVSEFRLAVGAPFTLVGVAPYAIVGDPEPQGGKLRDLKSKNKVTFKAEFVDPKRPATGKIKQWVNLVGVPAKKGTDGLGKEVEVTVGAEGDRDPAGVAKVETIGAAGIYVYIKVKFSGPDNRKSLRNAPKTDLAAGLNLSARVAVKEAPADEEWEFTGKIDLALAGGVGKFKLVLGDAGGDSCEVSIGSTDACDEATLTFTNWRKIWYEVMAPQVMAMEAGVSEDGTAVRDFPAALRTPMTTSGDATFIQYAIYRSQTFTELEATTTSPGSILKREFFQKAAGAAKCYLLTDFTFKKYPKAFDKGKGQRCSLIKACDVNLFNDGPGSDADLVVRPDATTVQADYDLAANNPNIKWSPNSAFSGGAAAASIRSISWRAKIATPATYKGPPDHAFDADVDDQTINTGDEDAVFLINESLQNPAACRVTFKKPLVGNTSTSLSTTAKAAIQSWLGSLWTDAKLRPHGFKLQISLTGRLGNALRNSRATALRTFITTTVNGAPDLFKHPGLKSDGTVRGDSLVVADVVDMTRSHWMLIAVNLPAVADDDPGKYVGALSNTTCPVAVTITFEPQHEGLGMAGQGAQTGELLLVADMSAPISVANTLLHELGHQYGLSKVAHGLPGIANGKGLTTVEPIVRYRDSGTKGHLYTGMGHSGGHCAFGLSDATKTRANFNGVGGAKCIMFGASSMNDATITANGFCPQCSDHVRAQDLSQLR